LGYAADRLSRRWLIFAGVEVWSISSAACGLAHTFRQLLVARIGVGFGEAALAPAAYSLLGDLFPPEALGVALSAYSIGSLLGATGALAIGGLVIRAVGSGVEVPLLGDLHDWQATFLVVGLPGVCLAALAFAISEPLRAHPRAPPPSWKALFQFAWIQRAFLTCHFGGNACLMIMAYAYLAWLPTVMQRSFGWTAARTGPALFLYLSGVGVPLLMANGAIVDRMFRRGRLDAHMRYYRVGALCIAAAAVAAWTARTPLTLLLCFAPIVGLLNFAGVGAAALQIVTPTMLRGRMSACYLMVIGILGLLLGPLLVGVVTEKAMHDDGAVGHSLLVVLVVFGLLASLLFGAGMRPMRAAVAGRAG
jgi:MFS family permease